MSQSQPRPDDILANADLDRLERARCYEGLNRELRAMGDFAVADIFGRLAGESVALVRPELRETVAHPPLIRSHAAKEIKWDVAACRTAYDAWAAAVDMEGDATGKLADLAARADDAHDKQLLMVRVRESLGRAATYRMHRRAAYHCKRDSDTRAAFPDTRRVQGAGDVALVSLAIERRLLRLIGGDGKPDTTHRKGLEITQAVMARLEEMIDGAPAPRRLRKWLDGLNAASGADSVSASFHRLQLIAEAGRSFDYYDRLFESAEDADTWALAQWLSGEALKRLQCLRGPTAP